MNPPILVLAYNRPELFELSLTRMVKLGITKCFVSIDGPKLGDPMDEILVREVRDVIVKFENKIEITYRMNRSNLGCNFGVSCGIDWFFEHVDHGIILEDDLDFDSDFILFLADGLERYKNDRRIGSINGYREDFDLNDLIPRSQLLTSYPSSWGWATWKNRWVGFEQEISINFQLKLIFKLLLDRRISECLHWLRKIKRLKSGNLDSWAYRWLLSNLKNGWLSVVPQENLISNRGFGTSATHTRSQGSRKFDRGRLGTVNPGEIFLSKEYDELLRKKVYGVPNICSQIIKKISSRNSNS